MKISFKKSIALISFSALSLFGAGAFAQDDLAEKTINEPRINGISVYGKAQTNSIVKDKNVLGGQAKRVVISKAVNPWDAAAQTNTLSKVKAGDELIGVATLRAQAPPEGRAAKVTLRFQITKAPYTGLKQQDVEISSDWAQYEIRVIADKDYGAEELALGVQVAHFNQTIDVGPIFIINMNKQVKGKK